MKRPHLNLEPHQGHNHVSTWTPEQIRLGSGWIGHEIAHQSDHLTAPYPWVPGWTDLDVDTLREQFCQYYDIR